VAVAEAAMAETAAEAAARAAAVALAVEEDNFKIT